MKQAGATSAPQLMGKGRTTRELLLACSICLLVAATLHGSGSEPQPLGVAGLSQTMDDPAALDRAVLDRIRADLPELALAVILTLMGAAATGLARFYWEPNGRMLLSFGLFTSLYGLRLFAWAPSAELLAGGPEVYWRYFEAVLTYVIPVPAIAFFEQFFGRGWKSLLHRMFQLQLAYAVLAIAVDGWSGQPFAAIGPYRPLVILTNGVAIAYMFRPRQAMTRDLKVLRGGSLAFFVLAANATLIGAGVLPWTFSAEPLGFFIFIVSLGYVAVDRFFQGQKQLIHIARELETARRIQSSILPGTLPTVDGMSLSVRYIPAAAVAGDFYDFLVDDGRHLAALVADVSGHGVPAALIASMVKVAFSAQVEHRAHPERVLSEINRILCGNLKGQFVTAACLYLDLDRGLLRYSTAGHPHLLLHHDSGERVREVRIPGIFMGVLHEADYECIDISIEPGDRVIIYTDGIVEASAPSGELFGKDRLIEIIESHRGAPAERLADALIEQVRQWARRSAGEGGLEDDLTLLVIDIAGSSSLIPPRNHSAAR